MQEGEKELGENSYWLDPLGVMGLALEEWGPGPSLHNQLAAESWPILSTSQALFSVKCVRAQEGEIQWGEKQ